MYTNIQYILIHTYTINIYNNLQESFLQYLWLLGGKCSTQNWKIRKNLQEPHFKRDICQCELGHTKV